MARSRLRVMVSARPRSFTSRERQCRSSRLSGTRNQRRCRADGSRSVWAGCPARPSRRPCGACSTVSGSSRGDRRLRISAPHNQRPQHSRTSAARDARRIRRVAAADGRPRACVRRSRITAHPPATRAKRLRRHPGRNNCHPERSRRVSPVRHKKLRSRARLGVGAGGQPHAAAPASPAGLSP